ncbi:hypothetical protein [Halorussus caseinilyticus]|uniref:Uncharacterized protein n=1 Tax=Halorussus caseinilyticus TaxID=3034025 RepID=A0ABD5WIT0_9EURY
MEVNHVRHPSEATVRTVRRGYPLASVTETPRSSSAAARFA